MNFADELRALASAHDQEKDKQKAAAEAATNELLHAWFTQVRRRLQAALRDAAREGKTQALVTRLYDLPMDAPPTQPAPAYSLSMDRRRVINAPLVGEGIHRIIQRQRRSGRPNAYEVRGSEVREHLGHPTLRDLWDDLVGFGLTPYVHVHAKNTREADLMVEIPR